MESLSRSNHFNFLKGYLLQILLCPFLDTLPQMSNKSYIDFDIDSKLLLLTLALDD